MIITREDHRPIIKGTMGEVIKKFPRQEFLDLIADGKLESEALAVIGFQKATLIQLQVKSPEFKEALENAKKVRADNWYEDIAKSVKQDLCKDEVPAAKLKFDQRKYLAAIDNPDKYAEKSKKEIDINVNIFQEMKDLPAAEARSIMAKLDPFNIVEAEFTESSELIEEEAVEAQESLEDLLS